MSLIQTFPSGKGSGDGEAMTPADLEQVKANFSLLERDVPEAMSAADLAAVKAAFDLTTT